MLKEGVDEKIKIAWQYRTFYSSSRRETFGVVLRLNSIIIHIHSRYDFKDYQDIEIRS